MDSIHRIPFEVVEGIILPYLSVDETKRLQEAVGTEIITVLDERQSFEHLASGKKRKRVFFTHPCGYDANFSDDCDEDVPNVILRRLNTSDTMVYPRPHSFTFVIFDKFGYIKADGDPHSYHNVFKGGDSISVQGHLNTLTIHAKTDEGLDYDDSPPASNTIWMNDGTGTDIFGKPFEGDILVADGSMIDKMIVHNLHETLVIRSSRKIVKDAEISMHHFSEIEYSPSSVSRMVVHCE